MKITPTSKPYKKSVLFRENGQREFTGRALDQIAFPLGGIGAGQINLRGSGNLMDFSIFNNPNLGWQSLAFATITAAEEGKDNVAKVIEGPLTNSRIFRNGEISGHWLNMDGMPRMKSARFRGEFPFAWIDFSEPDLPCKVSLEAWSPFIPLDDHHSSMPVGILTYRVRNTSHKRVKGLIAYHLAHMIGPDMPERAGGQIEAKRAAGIGGLVYSNTMIPPTDPCHSTFALATTSAKAVLKAGWFRGAHFDSHTMLWNEIASGTLQPSDRAKPTAIPGLHGAQGGSIGVPFSLSPQEEFEVSFIVSWHCPISHVAAGQKDKETEKACAERGWRPYYAAHWRNAWNVATYTARKISDLEKRTRTFHSNFFSTTAPWYVLDAASATLGILKSPTVLRLDDGRIWAWEGSHQRRGSCAGSCTHVWNYAQAMPHLFPQLERTMREMELENSMDERGHIRFRSALPPGPTSHDMHAAVDGQLGGIIKVYRDWQISGDDNWLRRLYPLAKRSLDYCIETWDPEHRGGIFEMHHNTYDIEFYGPDSLSGSFYATALKSLFRMANHLGKTDDAAYYKDLSQRAQDFTNNVLFNGEYYRQIVMTTELQRPFDPIQTGKNHGVSEEGMELIRKEGPMYQYGNGCLSDAVIGEWMAELIGLAPVLDPEKVRSTLASIFRQNFRHSMRRHENPQRGLYALNNDAGLLLCSWPHGDRPSLPFIYSDEVWTGIEYQVASHLIYNGMLEEGLTIIKAVRDRHDGERRNPWNEYECGTYYARSMASYSTLLALTGFRYSAVDREVRLDPRLHQKKLKSFFSTASGWGSFSLTRKSKSLSIGFDLAAGRLALKTLRVPISLLKNASSVRVENSRKNFRLEREQYDWVIDLKELVATPRKSLGIAILA